MGIVFVDLNVASQPKSNSKLVDYSFYFKKICILLAMLLCSNKWGHPKCTGLEEMIRNRQHQANPNRDIGKKEKTVSLVVE